MDSKLISRLITIGGIAVGLGLIAYGGFAIYEGLASQDWPTTSGKVLKAEVERFERTGDNGTSVFYQLNVLYEYQVNGEHYVGDKLRISSPVVYYEREEAEANTHIAQYPEGSAVRVYYDPNAPEQATLLLGYNPMLWFFVGGGVFFCLVAVGLERMGRNMQRW